MCPGLLLKQTDDRTSLKALCSIKGVGPAVSSVILTFYNPNKYGVFDIHAWRELYGKEPANLFSNRQNVLKFFTDSTEKYPLEQV